MIDQPPLALSESYARKALVASITGYAMDGFDLLLLSFLLKSIGAELRLTSAESGSLITWTLLGAVTGGLDFSNYFIPLSSKVTADSLAEAKKQGAVLAYGSFITIVLNFLIIAWVLFIAIKAINRLQAEEPKPPEPSKEVQLLTEIRDLLRK